MNHKLVVAIIIGNAQLIRELTAIGLHHVGDTSPEGAFNTGQLFKYRVAGSVRGIAQVLFSDFERALRQRCARRTAGIHQLIRYLVRTIRV